MKVVTWVLFFILEVGDDINGNDKKSFMLGDSWLIVLVY